MIFKVPRTILIKVGQVGVGYWGVNVARSFTNTGQAEIRWICDSDEDSANSISLQYPNALVTNNLQDLLSDPTLDAIAVITPTIPHVIIQPNTVFNKKGQK